MFRPLARVQKEQSSESGVHLLGRDGAEVSIVVETAVLAIKYPLCVPGSVRELLPVWVEEWADVCHPGRSVPASAQAGEEVDAKSLQ